MSVAIVYMTAKDENEAKKIAKALLDKRLIACANILGKATSIYEYKGESCEQTEAIAIFKTQKSLFEAIKEEVLTLHSYETPALLAFEAMDALEPFVEWVISSVDSRIEI